MRFLSKKEVKALTLYSHSQRDRLEHDGKFPKRVRLGLSRYARVGYVEGEVLEWMANKISQRDNPHDKPSR
jgi:predicted DNA-binding transcriptional regulator AlpA